MIKKLVTALLVLTTVLLCLVPAAALSGRDVSEDLHPLEAEAATEIPVVEILAETLPLFESTEGKYHTVVMDDNGALSIGCLQWHGSRALLLLKDIQERNPRKLSAYLGVDMATEIKYAKEQDWVQRVLEDREAWLISCLLETPEGIAAQDERADIDVRSYIRHGRALGITDPAALVYFCDIENQYGYSGVEKLIAAVKKDLKKDTVDSLEEMHYGILEHASTYRSRRNTTFAYCLKGKWTAESIISVSSLPKNMHGPDGELLSTCVEARGKDLTYRWYYREKEGTESFPVSEEGSDTNVLSLLNTEQNRNRCFFCLITDGNGKTRRTNEVKMDTVIPK